MPKKTDSTTKPTVPAAAAPGVPTPSPAPTKRAIKPAAKTKTTVKKPKAPPAKAKRPAPKATKVAAPAIPSFTREDVALRAYFISEKRRTHGLAGDEHQDWVEAERQLLAESGKPKKAKKAA